LSVVNGDTSQYSRYVDDVQLYTSNYDEARKALIELEKVLRTLGLNVQSAKTKIEQADQIFDEDVTKWESKLDRENSNRLEHALEFISEIFDEDDPESLDKWRRIYLRSLTVLGNAGDSTAVDIACRMFLNNPAYKELLKNFAYLKRFVPIFLYEEPIYGRLTSGEYLFDYHRAYLFRLAAFSRGEHDGLRQFALDECVRKERNWFCRVAALLFLSTIRLSGEELTQIRQIITSERNAQILRAASVVLLQYSGQQLEDIRNAISYFNAPHQEYLHRYFSKLMNHRDFGNKMLSDVSGASVLAPDFIVQLHRMDLLKANQHCRLAFNEILNRKILDCNEQWPRLKNRLQGIQESFIIRR
jgi:hypothetical protein